MKLYQKTVTGKIMCVELYTEGSFFCRKWGFTDSDNPPQLTRKQCITMNEGKANSTSQEEQAILEMEAKITKIKKEGYVENPEDAVESSEVVIDLDDIPKAFCPSKPISKSPDKVLNNELTTAQRKHNGHCIILVKTLTSIKKIFSRRMEDITQYVSGIPEIKALFESILPGSMVLTEFVFTNSKGVEAPRHIARLVRKKDAQEVMRRYVDSKKTGKFMIAPFDLLFSEGSFIGDFDYEERRTILIDWGLINVPDFIQGWQDEKLQAELKEKGWEGFVLRLPGEASQVGYTLNGKASKMGAYKLKFLSEDDFVVVRVDKGKAGKHAGFYAQFHLAQYMKNWNLTEFGKCGPGKLSHDELKDLTERIDSDRLKIPFVIEIEYASRQGDSGKLEFPQFVRVRDDKTPEECITDFEFETD